MSYRKKKKKNHCVETGCVVTFYHFYANIRCFAVFPKLLSVTKNDLSEVLTKEE